MTFTDIIRAIGRRLKLIILLELVIICLASFVSNYYFQHRYVSTAKLYVKMKKETTQTNPSEPPELFSQTELLTGTDLRNDYVELISSTKVRDAATIRSGVPDLQNITVTTYLPSNSRFIELTVEALDPIVARDVAAAFAIELKTAVNEVMGNDNIKIVDEPKENMNSTSPDRILIIVIAAIAGFYISIIFSLVLAYYDTKIKNEYEIKEQFDLPVLAEVPRLNQRQRKL